MAERYCLKGNGSIDRVREMLEASAKPNLLVMSRRMEAILPVVDPNRVVSADVYATGSVSSAPFDIVFVFLDQLSNMTGFTFDSRAVYFVIVRDACRYSMLVDREHVIECPGTAINVTLIALDDDNLRFALPVVDSGDAPCPICLEEQVYGVKLACGHELCMACFKETLFSCSLCRAEVSWEQIADLKVTTNRVLDCPIKRILGSIEGKTMFVERLMLQFALHFDDFVRVASDSIFIRHQNAFDQALPVDGVSRVICWINRVEDLQLIGPVEDLIVITYHSLVRRICRMDSLNVVEFIT